MQKLLTIIVPVYKVERYIRKCLDSLLLEDKALRESLEVIVVNDGTPDRSADISREYARQYPEVFRQIDKENGGHGSAWNTGLRAATGKYIKFLDSDDWFTNLDRLLVSLRGMDADIVFNPFVKEYVHEGRSETVNDSSFSKSVSALDPTLWGVGTYGYNSVNFWSLTYKAEILKPLQPIFAEGVMFDDYILTWVPLVFGRTAIALDEPVYHYFIGRPEQSMSRTNGQRGAYSYVRCLEQFETVRSRIDTRSIPADFLERINESITGYASYVFPSMIHLPYREAKKKMDWIWAEYLSQTDSHSSLQKRFSQIPFCLFFPLEKWRRKVNQIRFHRG